MRVGSGSVNTISAECEQEYGVPYGADAVNADMDYINSNEFAKKFNNITENKAVNETLLQCARNAIAHRNGTLYEDMYLVNGNTGEILGKQTESECKQGIVYNDSIKTALAKGKNENIPLIAFHSHPEGYPPSVEDFNEAYENNYLLGVVAGHNGQVYLYTNTNTLVYDADAIQLDIVVTYSGGADVDRAYREALEDCGLKYTIAKE